MNRVKILVSVSVVATFAMRAAGAGNAAAEAPDGPSPELKVLHKRVGNWQGATTVHKTMWTPEEIRGSNISSCVAILGGRFTLNRTEASNGESDLALVTYDKQRNCYRRWLFHSNGQTSEHTGAWNPEAKSMTWSSFVDDSRTSTQVDRYIDADTMESSVLIKGPDGKVYYLMTGKSERTER